VQVGGDVRGGAGLGSGAIGTGETLASVTVGGSLLGGSASDSGRILATRRMGEVLIAGDVEGGSTSAGDLVQTGYIQAKRIVSLTIVGSLIAGVNNTFGHFEDNGAVRVADDIVSATIGNLAGNDTNPAILSARGKADSTATTDVAIGRLIVRGKVELAQILAGFDLNGVAVNADAQIGPVRVGGDWVASSIAAGAVPGDDGFFGDGDSGEGKMSGGVKDVFGVTSRIASVTIAGQALGTAGDEDFYGIVAEEVGAVTVGGMSLPLTPGKDDLLVGSTDDFKVYEVSSAPD
jgi:hypothetical protein